MVSPSFSLALVGILCAIGHLLAEVTVFQSKQTIYDKSPKLRIKGAGFDAEDHDILIELAATNADPLKMDKDFLLTKDPDGDGLILKLLGNRRWANLDERTPPVALILSKVSFRSAPDKNLLQESIIVAQVLDTPDVDENIGNIVYKSASNELRINGTGFIGAKKVDLYFKPPLTKEVNYEDVSRYPLMRDEVVLRIRHGYSWREEPGSLLVIGVDTGGGPVKVNGDEGIEVADVQDDLDEHAAKVNPSTQRIYADSHDLTISGSGFNPIGNQLRFTNGLLGNNVNYTTLSTTNEEIKLRLTPGSYWRKNFDNLPGALTLLALNTGEGFIAAGPINTQKGRDIAMVFERPNVFSNNKKIFRTHSHSLKVRGAGFPTSVADIQLKFATPFVEGTDYIVTVNERDEMDISLLDGRAWRSSPGPLIITEINALGTQDGWVTLPGDGIHVAEVLEDIDAEHSGGVEVYQSGQKVYQSALRQEVSVTGSGFAEGMTLKFDPPKKNGVDYDMVVASNTKLTLKLRSGKKWHREGGDLTISGVNMNGKDYSLGGGEGIRIAVVLSDPEVSPSKEDIHESQSKLLVIDGKGFTDVDDTKITLQPSSATAYKVLNILDDAIRVQLMPDMDWLPAYMSLKDEDDAKKIALQLVSIDTGAGQITYDDPITVAYIVKDREGVTCDDSCEFAFDGVCDDGSEPNDQYYYEYYGYQDDDLGGFYYDDDENADDENADDENADDEEYSYYEGEYYDDYYMAYDDYEVSACVEGTDCTDCGGVDAIIDYTKPLDPELGITVCDNTCIYPRDGVCDDSRGTKYCELGTDCQDCGPVGQDNFTASDDDGWWDDDDDYWTFNDGNFLDQTKGLEANRHKVKVYHRQDSAGPAAMFLVVLEGMVYTVGAIFAAAALYLLSRWYKGQSIPFMQVFNPDLNQEQNFQMAPTKRMPITPDVIRT